MNKWLQTKGYICLRCGAHYLHDRAYLHALFSCAKRERAGALMKNREQPRITLYNA